jgi:hypothetical protein
VHFFDIVEVLWMEWKNCTSRAGEMAAQDHAGTLEENA